LDAGDLGHAGVGEYLGESDRARIINIDHHVVNAEYGAVNLVESRASSTSEIIYRLVKSFGIRFSPEAATSFLTGIITDTSFFVNAATSTEAMAAAGEMLQAGAEYNKIHRRLFKNKSLMAIGLWGKAFLRLSYNTEYGIATTAIKLSDYEGSEGEEAMEGITNYLCATLKVPVILALREVAGGKVKGSLRTVTDIDVSALAKAFGGGGHKKAAGFTVDGRLEETEEGWQIV
jgi:phosphoesterase RecJ-like protein